jgi:cob(I)alamin adenosyltransferase
MKIYTKTGDKGETSLLGGNRVHKDDLRIEAYGTVDELNSVIGIVRSMKAPRTVDRILERIQNDLFIVGADLAAPLSLSRRTAKVPRIDRRRISAIEAIIDQIQRKLPPLKRFILPGGSQVSSHLHLARAVCRRAERRTVQLGRAQKINPSILSYLNRLSDLLFILARSANQKARAKEVVWGFPTMRNQRGKG